MAKQDDKLFTVAGTATNPDGTTKVRFANDLVTRVKILTKAGCTNIELVELPQPMTKLAALEYLQEQKKSGDEGYVIANKLAEKNKVARRGEVRVTLKTGSKVKSKAKTKAERAVELGLSPSIEAARAVVGDEAL
jgi:phosphopantothenoylcysteine synthetase/decarboxylase